MFHAEGAVPDGNVRAFWLLKFPRGRHTDPRNEKVLGNEAPYLEVARRFGIRTGAPLLYEDGVLWVPRFDRRILDGRVERLGMHSLYAIAGIPGFGRDVRHDTYCEALMRVASDPARELREYLLRDILNLALRNTDNHGRNGAVLRREGRIELSPIFDFGPCSWTRGALPGSAGGKTNAPEISPSGDGSLKNSGTSWTLRPQGLACGYWRGGPQVPRGHGGVRG